MPTYTANFLDNTWQASTLVTPIGGLGPPESKEGSGPLRQVQLDSNSSRLYSPRNEESGVLRLCRA